MQIVSNGFAWNVRTSFLEEIRKKKNFKKLSAEIIIQSAKH